MLPLLLGLYVAVSLALAFIGRDTRVGPILIFLVSIFITPIFPAIYVMIARLERKDERVARG
jgi:predicted MFS family arabinose efflux permease